MQIPNGNGADHDPDYLDRLLNEVEAADFLGLKDRTLQEWRIKGCGPRFVRLSARAIKYRRRDLIAHCEARLRSSTAESDQAEA